MAEQHDPSPAIRLVLPATSLMTVPCRCRYGKRTPEKARPTARRAHRHLCRVHDQRIVPDCIPDIQRLVESAHQSYAVAAYVEQNRRFVRYRKADDAREARKYNEKLAANGDRWHMTAEQKKPQQSETLT